MPDDPGTPENPAPAVETADVVAPVENPSPEPQPAPETVTVTPPPPAEEPAPRPKVASVSDYERRLAEVTEAPAAVEPTPGQPAEEPAAPAPVAPAVTPPTPTDPPPSPPAAEPARQEFRPRLKALDSRKQEAVVLANALAAEGKPITLAEAERRVDAKYGVSPEPAPDPNAEPERTAEVVKAEIEQAEKDRREAIRQLDPDRQFEAEDKIRKLEQESGEISSKVQQTVVSQQTVFEAKVAESHALTAQVYPAYTMENHAIHAEANRIYEALAKSNNPLITQEDCPFKVYQMAANNLGIPPLDPDSQPPVAAPAAPAAPKSPTLATPKPQLVPRTAVVRPPSAVTPAPASARTTPHGPPTPAIGKIRTPADYEATVEQLAR